MYFESDGRIFTQKYVAVQRLISVCTTSSCQFQCKRCSRLYACPSKKVRCRRAVEAFFLCVVKSFDDEHDNFCYNILSENLDEKRMYENFCVVAIS